MLFVDGVAAVVAAVVVAFCILLDVALKGARALGALWCRRLNAAICTLSRGRLCLLAGTGRAGSRLGRTGRLDEAPSFGFAADDVKAAATAAALRV
eukprot:4886944-Pleurochrysis_carterae.AAC.1